MCAFSDDKPLVEDDVVNPWDYEDELVIFASEEATTPKYDPDYADYYDTAENSANNLQFSTKLSTLKAVFSSLLAGLLAMYFTNHQRIFT